MCILGAVPYTVWKRLEASNPLAPAGDVGAQEKYAVGPADLACCTSYQMFHRGEEFSQLTLFIKNMWV